MRIVLLSVLFFFSCNLDVSTESSESTQSKRSKAILVIHGGAGTILKKNMTPEKEKNYQDILSQVLAEGYEMLNNGRSSLDVVQHCVMIMEDSPLFNAGKGAVYNSKGQQEMDASIMEGQTLNAGAVAGVNKIKNPIHAARLVMDSSVHVMLSGKGALEFASKNGVELVDSSYFYNERRLNQLQRARDKETSSLYNEDQKFGTVGAVALDNDGNLAAATSTGGMTNKKFGRIGDSPIIGAATYADNRTCAVSSTGHGEYFIRLGIARDISAAMEYNELSVEEASDLVINEKLEKIGGTGGVIVLDNKGNYAMTFNTAGMYRGVINDQGESLVEIYEKDQK